ncbi:DUF1648 domain-containing protein [Siminovitchia sp. FSL H7-0308]|uniref:Membrane protein n=1 Tax=Siminovitchia thermophila TaxID=1245522 RepID=A0ABS2RD09_9BACI|nr:DUF1648 domain-containing protein [Siminovitchia thermophila]MBM7717548.1 putative membrane protein [Siminovitchia thermophila]ONK22341.1 hypothetical protein BLX87_16735 [Bacillus sp. VT-16-64]
MTLKDIIVFILIAAVIFVICLFLPEAIPIHFNAQGKADIIVNKYFLLLGSVIPYSIYWRFFRNDNGSKE